MLGGMLELARALDVWRLVHTVGRPHERSAPPDGSPLRDPASLSLLSRWAGVSRPFGLPRERLKDNPLLPWLAPSGLSVMLCTATRPRLLSTHVSAPIAPQWSPPSECKNTHRGLSGLCRGASVPTRSQVSIASGENSRCCTISRRTPLLPQGGA